MRTTRRQLLRWAGWFAAANALLFALLGSRYLLHYPFSADVLGLGYGLLAYVGHFALLASLPIGLLVVPALVLLPRRLLVAGLAVFLESLLLTLLVVDTNVFAEQRYHLTPLTAVLFEPATWIFIAVIAVVVLTFEALLGGYVWRWVEARPARGGRLLAIALCAAWLGSQVIHVWADASGETSVTQLTRYLPAYFPVHARRKLVRWGLVDPAIVERRQLLQKAGEGGQGQLRYPLNPMQCEVRDGPRNILMVLIDALRPDAIDPALLPNLAALRTEAVTFANHWSGGNSSKAGIFSMFYGLPSTYGETFYGVQQPPVLMDQMRSRGYQFGLFAAPGFSAPTDIERTVFAGVSGLPLERKDITAVERNRAVTNDWLAWLPNRDPGRPFFGFLYYDPPMGEMSADATERLPMDDRFTANPAAKAAWRKYRRSAQMVDGELGRITTSLRDLGLLDQTIVIVLSDHGYEFDDNGLGYIGHASDYSAAQLRATLIMRWPGREPAVFQHRSSHYDLPVTLLQDAFGCANDPADYSLGRNLFSGQSWDWMIAGSYNSHAIVEPDRVIVAHPGGFVEVLGADYRPLPGGEVDAGVVAEALAAMRRFYR